MSLRRAARVPSQLRARPRLGVGFVVAVVIGLIAGWGDQAHAAPPASGDEAAQQGSAQHGSIKQADETPGFFSLRRRYRPSGRYLDHGVIEFSAAGGIPEIYRIGLAVGLFNHLTVGIAGHWLPRQPVPVVVPQAALRLFQLSLFEMGLSYRGGLFPPPKLPSPSDDSAMVEGKAEELKPLFQRRAHFFMAGVGFVHENISAGAEVGLVRRRVLLQNVPKPNAYRFETVLDGASSVYVRVGNRCAGVSVQAFYPSLDVELRLDLRWPGFALGQRGCR